MKDCKDDGVLFLVYYALVPIKNGKLGLSSVFPVRRNASRFALRGFRPHCPPLRLRLSTLRYTNETWQLSRVRERLEICRQDLIIVAHFSGASRKDK